MQGAPALRSRIITCAIELEHLQAALAVWQYCYDSAQWVWGDAVGDPLADEIRRALRQAGSEGLTRTQIYEHLFARHVRRERIAAALTLLASHGLARSQRRETGGRPQEVWCAV